MQAFCAGGDVKATVQLIMKGEREEAPRSFVALAKHTVLDMHNHQ